MTIINSLFKHHPRRLFTQTSPNRKYKNQIDFCLISLGWISSIENIKTRPGADCGSDHQLLVAKLRIHLNSRHQRKPNQRINGKNEWESFGAILYQKFRQEDIINSWTDLKQTFLLTRPLKNGHNLKRRSVGSLDLEKLLNS